MPISSCLTGTSADYLRFFAGNDAYVKSNKIGLSMLKWGADWPDVYGDLDQVVTSDGIHSGGGSVNLGDYNSPQVSQLFAQYLGTTDATARNKIGTQIDQQVMNDAALVPLVYNKALVYHPANVTNWYMQPSFGEPDFSVLGVSGS